MVLSLFKSDEKQTKEKIESLELQNVVKKSSEEFVNSRELFGANNQYTDTAVKEFKHFLFLLWWNRRRKNMTPVVPTKRADLLWHGFLLYNASYNAFCQDVYGEIIAHKPGLEEGSEPFNEAVMHTKILHDEVGENGFDQDYFSYVDTSAYKKRSNYVGDTSGGTAGDKKADADFDGDSGDGGASCGGGCGGGCGG